MAKNTINLAKGKSRIKYTPIKNSSQIKKKIVKEFLQQFVTHSVINYNLSLKCELNIKLILFPIVSYH